MTLGDVDERLDGLEGLLSVFRVTDRTEALVCLSAIASEPSVGGPGGATPAGLWALVREALVSYGVTHERKVGIGEDAFMAVYGGVTTQIAWLTGDRLATASVICSAREQAWAADAAGLTAALADEYLALWRELRGCSA